MTQISQLGRQPLQRRDIQRRRSALLFALPGVVFTAALFIFPLWRTLRMSVSKVTTANLTEGGWPFVGLDNYMTVLHMNVTMQMVRNTAIFLSATVIPQIAIALLLAIGLRKMKKGGRVLRALILLPWLVPTASVATIFLFMFFTDGGVINWFLETLGVTGSPIHWFSNPGTALFVVIIVDIWIGVPFHFLIIQSGLQAIPDSVSEAAAVDGAGWFTELVRITIPMLRETLFAVLILGFIGTMKVFDFVWIMTRGGPINGTMLPGPLAYSEAFAQFRYGVGAAVVIMTLLTLVLASIAYVKYGLSDD